MVMKEYGQDYKVDGKNLDKTVTDVVQLLQESGRTIATAESLTGGLLSERITSVPGASQVFETGVCTYSDRMKHDLLLVPTAVLETHGAVSRETAYAMAAGLYRLSGADICLAVTGFAGPGGGTAEDPVGTVYAGISYRGAVATTRLKLWEFSGLDRAGIRLMTAACVFQITKQLLLTSF